MGKGYNQLFIAGKAPATLDEILACCKANTALNLAILKKLNLRGFRVEKPSRADLDKKMNEILTEFATLKRMIRRGDEARKNDGGYDVKTK